MFTYTSNPDNSRITIIRGEPIHDIAVRNLETNESCWLGWRGSEHFVDQFKHVEGDQEKEQALMKRLYELYK